MMSYSICARTIKENEAVRTRYCELGVWWMRRKKRRRHVVHSSKPITHPPTHPYKQILATREITPQVDLEEVEDIFDVLERQRQDRIEMGNLPRNADGEEVQPPPLPAALSRRFEVRLCPPSHMKAGSLREVRALDVGQLVKVKGMVTRTSDVKPLLTVSPSYPPIHLVLYGKCER